MYVILYFFIIIFAIGTKQKFWRKFARYFVTFVFTDKNILKNLIHINMANKLFYYLTIASIAATTASCNKEESASTVYDKAYPVILKAQSIGLEADKAPESYLKGEGIGVSLLENGTDNVVAPNSNICYMADGIGSYFVAEKSENVIYLPDNGEKRDIATYYPRVAEAVDKVNVDLITDVEFGAKLQFGRINGLDKDNREAELKMKNAISLVTMDIDASLVAGATGMTATLQNTPLKGSMNIYSGNFEATEFGTLTMTEGSAFSRSDGESIKKFFAMVIPATTKVSSEEGEDKPAVEAKDAKIEIEITKGEGEEPIKVEIKLADYTETLESAMNSNFNVSVGADSKPTVKVTNTSFSINDWVIDGDGIDVDGSESL